MFFRVAVDVLYGFKCFCRKLFYARSSGIWSCSNTSAGFSAQLFWLLSDFSLAYQVYTTILISRKNIAVSYKSKILQKRVIEMAASISMEKTQEITTCFVDARKKDSSNTNLPQLLLSFLKATKSKHTRNHGSIPYRGSKYDTNALCCFSCHSADISVKTFSDKSRITISELPLPWIHFFAEIP